ncbi:MAG: pyridoxal-phosphate dependent enzyme [Acidobacteriota bacterium]|nr:pyridoxal-phosphate dependent enzyme [Acidobacteriota bacterium]
MKAVFQLPPPPGPTRAAALPRLPATDPRTPSDPTRRSLWRWAGALEWPPDIPPLSLGEGLVPLERLEVPGLERPVSVLREDLEPTGSWKDRGSSLLVSALRARGIRRTVEDSSGNAALSLAAFCRAAGIELTACVPAAAPAVKKELVREAGARLEEVTGPRERASARARELSRSGGLYHASHAFHALHALGAATAAFNIVEGLGGLPSVVIAATGHGGLLAGLYAGLEASARGLGLPMPTVVGVQSALCAPLARAFAEGSRTAAGGDWPAGSLADGVAIRDPARGSEILELTAVTTGAWWPSTSWPWTGPSGSCGWRA